MAWSCGDPGSHQEVEDLVVGTISGVVFKGLLEDGSVVVKALGDGSWNEIVGEGRTDVAGGFDVEVGLARGHLLIEVSGGTYVEEATGDAVGLGLRRMQAWVPSFDVGEDRRSVQVNPVTTLVVTYTNWRMNEFGEDFVLAERRASRLLEEHFAGADWRSTLPANPTTRRDLPYGENAVMGVLISGLSWLTLEMARSSGTTSRAVNSAALLELLVEDLAADGVLNGIGRNGRSLLLHEQALDGQTLRLRYALSILRFLQSERNLSGLGRDDLETILYAIATRDSELFDTGPSSWHLDPPEISVDYPAPGSAVRGVIEIAATATDEVKVTDLGFTEPVQLRATDPVGRGQRTASILATLDTSLFPDGPLVVSLFAENDRELRSEKSFELMVANETPIVHISGPEAGAEVRGIVDVIAHAVSNPSTGARITRVYAVVPDDLTDTSAIASRFEASWDTTTLLDGEYTLELRAVDELGAEGSARVTVEISNREHVVIAGRALLAGRPVRSANVTALALDRPSDSAQSGYEQVGSATTDLAGSFTITVSDRNYDGPLVLRVQGTSGRWTSPIHGHGFSTSADRHLSTYLPSPDFLHAGGEQYQPVIIGGWSTIADRLARYYAFASPEAYTPRLAWARAEEMIAGHFVRSAYPSLHTTPTYDLTAEPRSLQEALFSLGEIGLVWMLRNRQDVSALDLVKALATDVATGSFDGNDGAMTIHAVGDVPINVDTTRMSLAMAIHQFVGSEFNASGIGQADLAAALGGGGQSFLDALSTDPREIWGPGGGPFDQSGPTITWIRPDIDAVFGNETVVFEARASDSTGIATFSIMEPIVDGQPVIDRSGTLEEILGNVSSSVPPNADDHYVRMELLAVDPLGHQTRSHRFFTRVAPTATIDALLRFEGGAWQPVNGPMRGILRIDASGTNGFATELFELVSPNPSLPAVGSDQNSSERALRVEIDTAMGIPDGPLDLEVCHRTIEGRQSCSGDSVIVDNTPPQVGMSLDAPVHQGVFWIGCAISAADCDVAPVTLNYVVLDATAGVVQVRMVGSGYAPTIGHIQGIEVVEQFDPAACRASECSGSLTVELPGGSYTLNLEAVDAAGNFASTTAVTVSVDTQAPLLQDHSGTFDNENQMDFRREGSVFVYEQREGHTPFAVSDALDGTAQWRKMEHRLSAATIPQAAAGNVPVIAVAAWDPGDPASSGDELVVEYLYGWGSIGGSFTYSPRGWLPLLEVAEVASGQPTHLLPLSLDWLGEELSQFSQHRVQVRAMDRAGNFATKAYVFTLELAPAPVAIEVDENYLQAGDPESIYAYGFEQGNLTQLFGDRSFEDGRVRIARVVVHQPHSGFDLRLKAEVLDGLEIHRSRRQAVVEERTLYHQCWGCEGPSVFNCGCVLFYPADPASDYPPCNSDWNSEDRFHVYKVYSDTGGTCFDNRIAPKLEPGDMDFAHDPPATDAVFYDAGGARIQPQTDGTFVLGEGVYTGYIRVPVPTNFISSTYTGGSVTVQGEVVQHRNVFDRDTNTTLVEERVGETCQPLFRCQNYFTRLEDVVVYEKSVLWQGERAAGAERTIGMSLMTGSMNPAVLSWRDPWTRGIDSDTGIEETYPVHHQTTMESDL